jgi:hypothetical protein
MGGVMFEMDVMSLPRVTFVMNGANICNMYGWVIMDGVWIGN